MLEPAVENNVLCCAIFNLLAELSLELPLHPSG